MTSNYSILFTIELLHEYFTDQKCPDFEIIPAEDTKAILKKARILFRNVDNRLIAFIEKNDDNEPFINYNGAKSYRSDFGSVSYRFYLKLRNPLFINYTNINLSVNNGKKFYFSNNAKNAEAGSLYLSNPVTSFANDKEFEPGDLVKDPRTGKVYEALQKYTSKKKTDLNDGTLWAPKGLTASNNTVQNFAVGKRYQQGDLVKQAGSDNIYECVQKHNSLNDAELNNLALWLPREQGHLQYVTENDVVDYSSGSYFFTLTKNITHAETSILGFNYDAAAPAYNVPTAPPEIKTFDQPTHTVAVNLSHLKPGRYLVKINGETRFVYYDPVLNTGNIMGVLEIFSFHPGTNDYSLLTDDEKIKKSNYTILFPSRRVLWKFIRKDSKAETITDVGNTGYEFNLTGNAFVSSTPIPLSEAVVKTLQLEFAGNDFKLSPLPNPSVDRLAKCKQQNYDYLCSEVFLNY